MALPSVILQRNTRALQPAANTVATGTLYCVTDENDIVEQSDGSSWLQFGSNTNGAMFWTGSISPTSLAADQNNYNPTSLSTASNIRQDCSANVNITGLAGGAAGRVLVITNISAANTITLKNESASSTAANRFVGSGNADVTLAVSGSCVLRYDGTSSRWRIVAISASSGGGGGTVTTTGSPASGNLTKFSGATSVTNGDLTGDVTTAGTLATTLATVTVPKGGTGQTTLTNHGVLLGQGASAVVATAAGGSGLPLVGAGAADPAFGQIAATTALSDYVAGTWTPSLAFGGASTGITYTTQQGFYIQIGKLVFCTMRLLLSSKGSATGNAVVSGLPVAAHGTAWLSTPVQPAGGAGTIGSGWVAFIGAVSGGVTSTQFLVGNVAESALTNAAFTNTTDMGAIFSYLAA